MLLRYMPLPFLFIPFIIMGQCNLGNLVDPSYTICPGDTLYLLESEISKFDGYFLFKDGQKIDSNQNIVSIDQAGNYTISAYKGSNENLIVNGSFYDGNFGFESDYIFTPLGPYPGTEYYSVGNTPSIMNGFWTDCPDVTGEGEFLIADGAKLPNFNVWCQTIDISPGLDYIFRFFSTSLYPVSPANYEVRVNGQLIGSAQDTEDVCNWSENEFNFFSGNQEEVEICIQNVNLEGFGNDFAIDSIALYGYCEETVNFQVVEANLTIELTDTAEILCKENELIIALTDYPQIDTNNIAIEWSTIDGNILERSPVAPYSIKVDQTGTYRVKVIFENENSRCEAVEEVIVIPERIDLLAFPSVDEKLNCANPSILLEAALAQPDHTYSWFTDNGAILSRADSSVVEIDQAGIYYLIEDVNNRCRDTTSILIDADFSTPNVRLPEQLVLNCNKQSFLLSNSAINSDTDLIYSWNGPGISSAEDSIILDAPGTYFLNISDSSSQCMSTDSVLIVDSVSYPALDLESVESISCRNSFVDLSLINPDSGFVYTWSSVNGSFVGPTNVPIARVDEPGQYIVEVLNPINQCVTIDSLTVSSDFDLPGINTPDSLGFTCRDSIFEIEAVTDFNFPNLEYYWFSENGQILSDTSLRSIFIGEEGLYYFTVHNTENGCMDTASSYAFFDQNEIDFFIESSDDKFDCKSDAITLSIKMDALTPERFMINWFENDILQDSITGDSLIIGNPGTYRAEITNLRNGCLSVDTVDITGVNSRPSAFDLFYQNPDCLTESAAFALSNVQGGQMPYTILLNSQAVPLNDTINIDPGNYIAQVVDANGCVLADTFQVNELPIYSANIGPDITITAGDNELLIPQFSFDTSLIEQINWFPNDAVSCDSCVVTEFIAPQTTELELLVTTEDGCSARANVLITVLPARDVFIPSAFSPNADNINDFFTVFVSDERVRSIKRLQVFDRWGNQVFDNKDFPPNEQVLGWDGTFNGKELDPAVFIYAAEVEFVDGTTRLFSGDVI